MTRRADLLLCELEGTLVQAVSAKLHQATLVGSIANNFADDLLDGLSALANVLRSESVNR